MESKQSKNKKKGNRKRREKEFRSIDLLDNRIIYLDGEITEESAKRIIETLLKLDIINHKDIKMYINSEGGSVNAGLAIVDTMNSIKSDIATIGIGRCASMAAILLINGTTIGFNKLLDDGSVDLYKVKVGEEEGMMNFCIPYLVLEPIVSKLSSQYWFSSVRKNSTTQYLGTIKQQLTSVDMDVVADFGSINLPIRDVLSLRVGDVIRLSNIKVGDPLSLSVGNEKKFYCQPGVVGKKMAVQITGKVENVESDEFEELSVEGDETYE